MLSQALRERGLTLRELQTGFGICALGLHATVSSRRETKAFRPRIGLRPDA